MKEKEKYEKLCVRVFCDVRHALEMEQFELLSVTLDLQKK